MPLPGGGRLRVALVDGASAVVGCEARSPLQLLAPRPRGPAAWVIVASHGGGLLDVDGVHLEVDVGEGAAALLATQAETKVYRSRGGEARQELHARVGAGGALAVLPSPVSCYAGARGAQRQRFELAPGASLLLLDALAGGRIARGERWAFARWRSENRVLVGGRLALHDALHLEPRPGRSIASRLPDLEALAVVVAVGPAFLAGARALAARVAASPAGAAAGVLVSATDLPRADGVLLRLAARTTSALDLWLRDALSFAAGPLGGDPFARRW